MSNILGCYFVVKMERSPACYDLEVCTDTWDSFETVFSIDRKDIPRVEMELMNKWKDNPWRFVPAPSYNML